jgi:hypothetical protein
MAIELVIHTPKYGNLSLDDVGVDTVDAAIPAVQFKMLTGAVDVFTSANGNAVAVNWKLLDIVKIVSVKETNPITAHRT